MTVVAVEATEEVCLTKLSGSSLNTCFSYLSHTNFFSCSRLYQAADMMIVEEEVVVVVTIEEDIKTLALDSIICCCWLCATVIGPLKRK